MMKAIRYGAKSNLDSRITIHARKSRSSTATRPLGIANVLYRLTRRATRAFFVAISLAGLIVP